MAPQRATLYTYGNDELCAEMQKFIEDAGILLTVRDIGKQPFTPAEFYELVGNLSLEHFINPASTLHPANGDSEDGLNRRQLLDKVSEDPTVLRRPILKTSRLVTVGADRKRIAEALQLNNNGTPRELQNPPQPSNHHRRART